jgi:hypothetical protein
VLGELSGIGKKRIYPHDLKAFEMLLYFLIGDAKE